MNQTSCFSVALATLTACTPTTGVGDKVEAPHPGPARAVEAPSEPAASASPPTQTPDPDEPEPEVAPVPVFHHVARSEPPDEDSMSEQPHWRVFAVGDQIFATAGPQVLHVQPGATLARDPKWLAGIEWQRGKDPHGFVGIGVWDALTVGGRWPDALYLVLISETGFRNDAQPNTVYRRTDDRWTATRTRGDHFYSYPARLAPWSDGQVLALRRFTPDYHYFAYEDETDEPSRAQIARAARSIGKAKKLVVIRGTGKAPDLGHDNYDSFDALPSGEIIAVITPDPGKGSPVAIHYDPRDASTRELPLPEDPIDQANVTLVSSQDAWVYGLERQGEDGPYLAHFDGTGWTRVEAPPCKEEGIASFSTAAGAGQWAVCGPDAHQMWWSQEGELWHRSEEGPWQLVALPDNAKAIDVVARGPDDIWVAGDGLFHTRKPKAVLTVPGFQELGLEVLEHAEPADFLGCDHSTVLLERDPAGEHADLQAAIGEALERTKATGWFTLAEVPFRGEPRLALQASYIKPKRRVRAALEAALGDVVGGTWCVSREPTREVKSWHRED